MGRCERVTYMPAEPSFVSAEGEFDLPQLVLTQTTHAAWIHDIPDKKKKRKTDNLIANILGTKLNFDYKNSTTKCDQIQSLPLIKNCIGPPS